MEVSNGCIVEHRARAGKTSGASTLLSESGAEAQPKEPAPYMFGSGMTNSALLSLAKPLATEFGKVNVLVNAICPAG